jgi:hypothetical protein
MNNTLPLLLRLIPWRLLALINADTPTPPKTVGAAMDKAGTRG